MRDFIIPENFCRLDCNNLYSESKPIQVKPIQVDFNYELQDNELWGDDLIIVDDNMILPMDLTIRAKNIAWRHLYLHTNYTARAIMVCNTYKEKHLYLEE